MAESNPERERARQDAIVNGMAEYLAGCLSLKDPAVEPTDDRKGREGMPLHWSDNSDAAQRLRRKHPSVATIMHDELRYMPEKEQLDALEDLMATEGFAIATLRLSERMMCESNVAGAAIHLRPHSASTPYFRYETYELPCSNERTRVERLRLGGVGGLLRDAVYRMARTWLRECDRQMLVIRSEATVGETAELSELIETLSLGIARHATLTKPFETDGVRRASPLDANFLHARANAKFASAAIDAQAVAASELRAVRQLYTLARHGVTPMAPLARETLCGDLHALRRLLVAPPPELGPLPHLESKGVNVQLLADALKPDAPARVREEMVMRWADRHGNAAANAAAKAIQLLESFSPVEAPRTLSVITRDPDVGKVPLPRMPWLGTADRWYLVPPPTRPAVRSGLDGDGPRIVRLLSLVWWLVSHDERAFAEGVIGAPVVDRVCCEVHMHARLMCSLIDNERDMCSIGATMLTVAENLCDKQSMIADDVSKALCALSYFSMREIYSFYHPRSKALAAVSGQLALATRNAMTTASPPDYHYLTRDALATLLPVLEQRRTALAIPQTATPLPLGDLLRTVRGWSICSGAEWEDGWTWLDAATLRGAHPRTASALDEYAATDGARANGVVAEHHTRKGVPRAHARIRFGMPNSHLFRLLRS
jgi:hypothetical protein